MKIDWLLPQRLFRTPRSALGFAVLLVLFAPALRAQTFLLTNTSSAGGNGIQRVMAGASSSIITVSFTTPADNYYVTQISLRLRNYQSDVDPLTVGIYLWSGGGYPGALQGSLFTNPTSTSNDIQDLIFSHSGVALAPSTFFVVAIQATGSSSFEVVGEGSNNDPTGLASYSGTMFNGTYPGTEPTLSINAVPEPAASAVAFGFAALGFVVVRRRKLACAADRTLV